MASEFKLTIGGTDYGTLGENVVTGFEPVPTGAGQIGKCAIQLMKDGGGGYTITSRMEVNAWMTFDGANGVAADGRMFGGWLIKPNTSQLIGTNVKVWHLLVADDNILLDGIVRDATEAKAINLSADTFSAQVLALITAIQENGIGAPNKIMDASTYVANLTGSMPAQILPPGKSLRWYLQALCDTAQSVDSGLRPRFHLGRATTSGVGDTFGNVCVHIYDIAQTALASPQYTFSTEPAGAEKAVMDWNRELDAANLAARRQLISPIGTVFTAADSTAGNAYPNPYINHALTDDKGYWMAEPIEAPDDSASTEWQDAIDKSVAQTAYPRESIRLRSRTPVAPGTTQAFTAALEGLAAEEYKVADVSYSYPTHDPLVPFVEKTLGQRRLQWFETGDDGIDSPPREGDIVPPATPTGLAVSTNVILPGGEEARVTLTWAASTSEDVAGYKLRWEQGTRGETVDVGDVLTHYFDLVPELAHNFYVQAYDGHGNHSAFSAAVAATTASRPPTDGLFNPSFEYRNFLDSTMADGWTRAVTGTGTAALSTAEVNTGNRSIALTVPSAASTAAVTSRGVLIPANARRLIFTMFAKANLSTNILTATALWFKSDDTASATPSTTLITKGTVTNAWMAYRYTPITPPSDAAYVKLEIKGEIAAGVDRILYVDTCSVFTLVNTEEVDDDAITGDKLNPAISYDGTITLTGGGKLVIGNDPAANQIEVLDEDGNSVGFINGEGTAAGNNRKMTISGQGVGGDLEISPDGDLLLNTGQAITIQGASGTTITGTTTMTGAFVSSLVITGEAVLNYTGVSANTTLDTTHLVVSVDTSGGAKTITLPAALGATERVYVIKNAGANTVTIDGNGAETIDGATTYPLLDQYDTVMIQSDGSNWKVLAANLRRSRYYDGTRWLGEEFAIPLTQYQGTVPLSATTEYLAWAPQAGHAVYLTRFSFSFYLGANADGSNYWKAKLRTLESDGATIHDLGEIQTANGTGGGWTKTTDLTAFSNNPLETNDIWLQLYMEKTGSPNSIYPIPGLFGRLVLG